MIHIKIDTETHDTHAMALEIEQISQLIAQGQKAGENWTLTGEDEKEPIVEDDDEEIISDDIFYDK